MSSQTSAASYDAGFIRTERRRATQAEMRRRRDVVYDIVAKDHPTSIRFVFYRATSLGLVPKNDNRYQMICRVVTELRKCGRVPWHWLVDTSRSCYQLTSWTDLDAALEDWAATYSRSYWARADERVEVWCESESVAGVLKTVTTELGVPLFPIKGHTSYSFAFTAAETYRADPRDVYVYYVGDHDPAGLEIAGHLRQKLELFAERDINFMRLGVTESQIVEYALQGTKPKKTSWTDSATGSRFPWHGQAVEVEALHPEVLRSVVSNAVDFHIDRDQWDACLHLAQAERDAIRDFIESRDAA